jgi:hypothetical protein
MDAIRSDNQRERIVCNRPAVFGQGIAHGLMVSV